MDLEYQDYFTCVVCFNEHYLSKQGTKIKKFQTRKNFIISQVGKKCIQSNLFTISHYLYNLVVKINRRIVIQAEYNKFILFAAKDWHSVSITFGDSKLISRLSQSYYLNLNKCY